MSGPEIKAKLGRDLRIRVPLAHVVGAVLALTSGALTAAHIKNQPGVGRLDVITFAIYLAVSGPAGWWYIESRTKRATNWLDADRSPTRAEQRDALSIPWRTALAGMVAWLGAAVIWALITVHFHDSVRYTTCVALSIVLGGLTTSGVDYLLVEWTMRPVVAAALAGDVPEHPIGPGVRTKLVLSWLVGADVFLLMIGLSVIGRPANQPPSRLAIWFIIGAGLSAGSIVVYVASRSLVTPLLELRNSVARVQRGDLDVSLVVNDGGELGLVQAGFNQMVSGLQERRTLHDLFGRHVGEDVARQALANGDVRLGGERREVGAVFVDIIGSTRLAQTHSPEHVVTLLNRFFATVVRVVADEGGWVNKFEGDGALCVFGAPVGSADCALRALRAARTLRKELLALSATDRELDAAIGVSAGPVVAGNVGAEQRYEYTIIGSPVNQAARLTTQAKLRLGRVLASEEAISRAGSEARWWTVASEMQLRGYDEPVLVYEPADHSHASVTSDVGAG